MALFNLTDIKFKKDRSRGPLNPLVSSEYETTLLRYPIDLGSYDKGHYMVIYINQQENTASEFKRGEASGVKPTVLEISEQIGRKRGASNFSQLLGVSLDSIIAGLEALARGESVPPKVQEAITTLGGKVKNLSSEKLKGNILRRISRTTDAIALYMPDTLNFIYNQGYSDLNSYETVGKIGTVASVFEAFKTGDTKNLSSFAVQAIRDFNVLGLGDLATLGFAAFGTASNPGLELIYSTPSFRPFRFDFMFYPRDQKEALQVLFIIRKLQFHQAPEIVSNAGGRFLIPPSEFDIKFYYNGKENPNIPKISTCVLDSIDVDYAPNGFAAYEVPLQNTPVEGGTGTPVGIRLSLQFKETQIVTKEFLTVTEQLPYEKDYTAASQRGEFGSS